MFIALASFCGSLLNYLHAHSWVILHALFISKLTFQKNLSGIPTECQMVWTLIRPDYLLGFIGVLTVCKGYQQTTMIGNELNRRYTLKQSSNEIQLNV